MTDNVQAIMNGLLYNRDLKFEVHRERPKNPYVLADVTRIREVLVNLLGNAVKFTKDGGKITLDISSYPGAVSYTHLTVLCEPGSKDHILFCFSDPIAV